MLPQTDRDARAAALRRAAEFHRATMLEPERAVTMGVPDTEDRGLVILPTALLRWGMVKTIWRGGFASAMLTASSRRQQVHWCSRSRACSQQSACLTARTRPTRRLA